MDRHKAIRFGTLTYAAQSPQHELGVLQRSKHAETAVSNASRVGKSRLCVAMRRVISRRARCGPAADNTAAETAASAQRDISEARA